LEVIRPDFKPIGTGGSDATAINRINPGSRGAAFAPHPEFREALLVAFGLHFDAAIAAVAHPASEAQFLCSAAAPGPVAHTLYQPSNAKAPTFSRNAQGAIRLAITL
tara:strand:+ start:296 stop:616 length:321 start_codon:yes stop_codon:yes gene_type:complete